MSYVSTKILTRHCGCTVFTTFPLSLPLARLTHSALTWDAVVGDLQVRCEVAGARLSRVESGHCEATTTKSTGTHGIHFATDIGSASHVTIVAAHTATKPHSTVQRRPHYGHFRRINGWAAATVGVECLQLTVVASRRHSRYYTHTRARAPALDDYQTLRTLLLKLRLDERHTSGLGSGCQDTLAAICRSAGGRHVFIKIVKA